MLSVYLFGKLSLSRDAKPLACFEAGKLQELFGYLMLHRHAPQTRETLAELFWPAQPAAQARKHLRQTLWHLQSSLRQELGTDPPELLAVDADWVQVTTAGGLWVDVFAFEEVFLQVQDVAGHLLSAEQAALIKQAVEWYQDDLLINCYEDWCLFERERLRHNLLLLLDKLMVYCEQARRFEEGISYGERILGCDQAREHTHRELMRLHYLAGNRTGALRQYRNCERILWAELGVKPARRTIQIYEQICADCLDDALIAPGLVNEAANAATRPVLELLDRFQDLSQAFAEINHTLVRELKELELRIRERH
jgi:DNA-binding SARP family transcriptional activator